jgi:arsenate reductase (glutaredoxin)
MSLKIYHNPRCSKSRRALEILKSKGLEPEVIEYLKAPPNVQELEEILKMLRLKPQEIIRTKEDVFQQMGLANKNLSRREWIEVLVKNPVLIERPIVVYENKAVLCRPPEKVLEIL